MLAAVAESLFLLFFEDFFEALALLSVPPAAADESPEAALFFDFDDFLLVVPLDAAELSLAAASAFFAFFDFLVEVVEV